MEELSEVVVSYSKGNKSVLSLMTKADALPAGFQKWNKLFDNLNWKKKNVTELQKPQMTHDFVGFRCDFCIEFYQQADICFCEKSLIHHYAAFASRELN